MKTDTPVHIIDLGRMDYRRAHQLQQRLVTQRTAGDINDTLLFVEHEHVFTRGRKSKDNQDVLMPGNVPVIDVERGGEVTYHGPGQLVIYPIFALREEERDAPKFIRTLENWLIETLKSLGIPEGKHERGYSGVWVRDKKIASVGVAVTSRWITWHGIALNLSTNLSYFQRINPCGLSANVMTSVEELMKTAVAMNTAKDTLRSHINRCLNRAPLRSD